MEIGEKGEEKIKWVFGKIGGNDRDYFRMVMWPKRLGVR